MACIALCLSCPPRLINIPMLWQSRNITRAVLTAARVPAMRLGPRPASVMAMHLAQFSTQPPATPFDPSAQVKKSANEDTKEPVSSPLVSSTSADGAGNAETESASAEPKTIHPPKEDLTPLAKHIRDSIKVLHKGHTIWNTQ